jgi:hypothetical protein
MGANETKNDSAVVPKTKRKRRAGPSSSSSSSTSSTSSPSTSFPSSRQRTPARITKLCTQEGIQQLADIFKHQSFLCGAGWTATQEDAVVFARLQPFMHHIVQLEVGRLDVTLKEHAKRPSNGTASGSHNSLDRMKRELQSKGVCCLETSLMAACKELSILPSEVVSWFENKRSFWRWFRCLNVMEEKDRSEWLPTIDHLKSGRVSMLFDL